MPMSETFRSLDQGLEYCLILAIWSKVSNSMFPAKHSSIMVLYLEQDSKKSREGSNLRDVSIWNGAIFSHLKNNVEWSPWIFSGGKKTNNLWYKPVTSAIFPIMWIIIRLKSNPITDCIYLN